MKGHWQSDPYSIRLVSLAEVVLSIPKVSIRQIKAARALLDWSQEQLAEQSGVSIPTVKRLEAQDGMIGGRSDTGDKLCAALENAGVIFVAENGEGPGVRLRKVPLDHAAIADKIADLDAKAAALKHDGTPSPDNALKTMKRAVVKNEATKLRNKLAKAKGGGP